MFIIYIIFLYIFVLLFINSGNVDQQISELDNVSELFTIDIKYIVVLISVFGTTLATLLEYIIASFLITLFIDDGKSNFGDVYFAKSVSLSISIFIFTLLTTNATLVSYLSFISVVIIFLSNYLRYRNIKLSTIFSLPFLVNVLYSVMSG